MADKNEKNLDRIATALEALVKVQKEELRILKDSHRLSMYNYELNAKMQAKHDEINRKIQEELDKTTEEIKKWEQQS